MAGTSSSKTAVYAELVGNLLVAVTKAGAAVWTGSDLLKKVFGAVSGK
jgi:divalent metal cation (Fe/Co/Zn/Cd) transporter